MFKYALMIFMFSSPVLAQVICNEDNLKYPEDVPIDFRWKESEINMEAAKNSVEYMSRIVEGDLSKYHWITSSHSESIIHGYTLKLLALRELNSKNVKNPYFKEQFCGWLSNAVKAD